MSHYLPCSYYSVNKAVAAVLPVKSCRIPLLKSREKENEERNNDVVISASSMPIGDRMKTGKLSRPVSDNSQSGIVIVGNITIPILARDQSLAFLTFDRI